MRRKIITLRHFSKVALTYASGDAVNAISGFIVAAILMRRLSPVEWGHYTIAQAICSILTVVVAAGMMLAASPEISKRPTDVGLIIWAAVLLRLAAWAACAGAIGLLSTGHDGPLAWAIVSTIWVLLAQVFNFDFALVGLGRSERLAKARFASAVSLLAITLVAVSPLTRAWHVPLFTATGLLVGYIIQFHGLGQLSKPPLEASVAKARELGKAALPVTMATVAQISTYNLDTILLGFWGITDVKSIGEYAALSKLTQLATMPLVAILFTGGPQLARASIAGDWNAFRRVERMLRISFATVGVAGGLGIALFGSTVIEILTKRKVDLGPQVSLCFGVSYLLIGFHSAWTSTLPFLGDHRGYMLINLGATLVMSVCLVLLLHFFGMTGAACSLVVALASLLLLGVRRYRRVTARATTCAGGNQ